MELTKHEFLEQLRVAPPKFFDLRVDPGTFLGRPRSLSAEHLVPFYKNNWVGDNIDPVRLAGRLDGLEAASTDFSDDKWQFVFKDYADRNCFINFAENYERLANRLPNTPLGNWMLSFILRWHNLDDAKYALTALERASHSHFGCHVFEMAYVDQSKPLSVVECDPLVRRYDEQGFDTDATTFRVSLINGDSPFAALALWIVVSGTNTGRCNVDFEFAVRLSEHSPWSVLQTTKRDDFSVAYYVRKLARRSTPVTDIRKPFK